MISISPVQPSEIEYAVIPHLQDLKISSVELMYNVSDSLMQCRMLKGHITCTGLAVGEDCRISKKLKG
jgi:hypothetical protein